MSNRTYLFDVKSVEEAETGKFTQNDHWLSNWVTPVFWYACFTPDDEIKVRSEVVDASYLAFLVNTEQLPSRLSQRKSKVIALMPEPLQAEYGKLFDRFSGRLLHEFKDFILLDFLDLFAMNDMDVATQSGIREEIQLFNSIFEGYDSLTLDDLLFSGAFEIGTGVAPAQLDRTDPRKLAQHWRFVASGESSTSPGFLHEPSLDEIEFATKVLAEQKAEQGNHETNKPIENPVIAPVETPDKPWWKFWGN